MTTADTNLNVGAETLPETESSNLYDFWRNLGDAAYRYSNAIRAINKVNSSPLSVHEDGLKKILSLICCDDVNDAKKESNIESLRLNLLAAEAKLRAAKIAESLGIYARY